MTKACAYMKQRVAFGRKLAEFQALQFRLADMATELEVAQSFLWRAASSLDVTGWQCNCALRDGRDL